MTNYFPYILLDKQQIIQQINHLAALRTPFLFIVDYKAEQGYVIKEDEQDKRFVRFDFQSRKSGVTSHESKTIQWFVEPVTGKIINRSLIMWLLRFG